MDCASNEDFSSTCQDMKVCLTKGGLFESIVRDMFPDDSIVVGDSKEEAVDGLVNGDCNVIAGGIADVSKLMVETAPGFFGEYEILPNLHAKNPLALATSEKDPRFSSFVYWVVSAIVASEEQGIEASLLPAVNLFGPSVKEDMLRNAVTAVGNFGDIYQRNLEQHMPRGGLNKVNRFLEDPRHYPLPGIV